MARAQRWRRSKLAGQREADVALAVVIRTPPTFTRRHPSGQIAFLERDKGAAAVVSKPVPSRSATSVSRIKPVMNRRRAIRVGTPAHDLLYRPLVAPQQILS